MNMVAIGANDNKIKEDRDLKNIQSSPENLTVVARKIHNSSISPLPGRELSVVNR